MTLPRMRTPIRITPCATSARFGSKSRNVMSFWISWSTTTATIGPKTPPRPPARLTPAEHDRRDAFERVRARNGRADRRARRQGEAANRREQPGEHVREDLRPADRHPAPERRELVAADRRRSTGRAANERQGSRSIAAITIRTTADLGIHSLRKGPTTRSVSQLRGRAARRRPDQEREARPDERHGECHDDVRHAGDHDDSAVDRTEGKTEAQDADGHDDSERVAPVLHEGRGDHARERHHRADGQVDPAGDDDDRLGDGGERRAAGPTIARPWIPATP